MLELHNGDTSALIDPDRGLTVRSLKVNDVELMATVPWVPETPEINTTDPERWVRAWAGGWQPTLPNAGFAAPKGNQGYHGAASQAVWAVTAQKDAAVVGLWRDTHGLEVHRALKLSPDGIELQAAATNGGTEPRPIVITEHLVLGADVLTDGATVEAPGTTVYPLNGPGERQPSSPWPGTDDWSVAKAGVSPARCAAVTAPNDGASVHSGNTTVRITWDTAALPYFWLWQEIAANPNPPWDGKTMALGIEPSTTPHGQGLDIAAPDGDCALIEPGATLTWWVRLAVT